MTPDYLPEDVMFSVDEIVDIALMEIQDAAEATDGTGNLEEAATIAVFETLDYIAQHLHERGNTDIADLITFLTHGDLVER
jgi:hypothetical protein